jgi:hypothetical protein
VRNCPDERSYIIEPLLEADPYSKMPGFMQKTHLKRGTDPETDRLEPPSDDEELARISALMR